MASVLWDGYPPGMGQQSISVAQAVELLRRQPQDAEARVVEVIMDAAGNVVGHADRPATGADISETGPPPYFQSCCAPTADRRTTPRADQ